MIRKSRLRRSTSADGGTDPNARSPDPASAANLKAAPSPGAKGFPGSAAHAADQPVKPPPDGERREHSFQLSLAILAGLFAIAAALVGALASGVFTSSGGQATPSSSSSPAAAPLTSGDASAFIRDVTYPDYSKVRVNKHFIKTWELKNVGIVKWTGRYLAAMGPSVGKCIYPHRVRIRATAPGDPVDISVNVTAANSPGLCYVTWRMVTSTGRLYFPGNTRGIWFKVNVISAKSG